ncbi:MAG: hypothetical protein KGM44_12470 [bacterium]|nr:hypothetical protein [bacterium]
MRAFFAGLIVGLVVMFGLVRLGYIGTGPSKPAVVVGQTPAPAPAAAATAAGAAEQSATPGQTPSQEPGGTTVTATPAGGAIGGNTFAWTGPQGTITYTFHGDGTYDASYSGEENGARTVGASKGMWKLEGTQLSTHETAGTTRRTTGGSTTTRPAGAGDVTFGTADGKLTDPKGRVYERL